MVLVKRGALLERGVVRVVSVAGAGSVPSSDRDVMRDSEVPVAALVSHVRRLLAGEADVAAAASVATGAATASAAGGLAAQLHHHHHHAHHPHHVSAGANTQAAAQGGRHGAPHIEVEIVERHALRGRSGRNRTTEKRAASRVASAMSSLGTDTACVLAAEVPFLVLRRFGTLLLERKATSGLSEEELLNRLEWCSGKVKHRQLLQALLDRVGSMVTSYGKHRMLLLYSTLDDRFDVLHLG